VTSVQTLKVLVTDDPVLAKAEFERLQPTLAGEKAAKEHWKVRSKEMPQDEEDEEEEEPPEMHEEL
jgi:hypothetical protein